MVLQQAYWAQILFEWLIWEGEMEVKKGKMRLYAKCDDCDDHKKKYFLVW
jgi:hypothetical protein